MGIFGTLFKVVVDVTVILPVAIVQDVLTLGGAAIEEPSATGQAINIIKEDLDEITD